MQGRHHSPLIFDEVTQTQSKVTQSKAELDLDSKAPIIHTTLALCQLQPHTTRKKVMQTQNSLNQQPQGGTNQRKWGEFWGEDQRSRQVRPEPSEAKVNSQVSG